MAEGQDFKDFRTGTGGSDVSRLRQAAAGPETTLYPLDRGMARRILNLFDVVQTRHSHTATEGQPDPCVVCDRLSELAR